MAFFAPARVPADVTNALVPAIEKAVKDPAIVSRLTVLGMAQDYVSPEKFLAELRDENPAGRGDRQENRDRQVTAAQDSRPA